jgi:hypothetical protein
MTEIPRSFRIKYAVHCRFKNFFNKEMIVKKCYSKLHAKIKLGKYYENKYGSEFEYISFISVEEECSNENFDDILKTIFDDKDASHDYLTKINDLINKKKK